MPQQHMTGVVAPLPDGPNKGNASHHDNDSKHNDDCFCYSEGFELQRSHPSFQLNMNAGPGTNTQNLQI